MEAFDDLTLVLPGDLTATVERTGTQAHIVIDAPGRTTREERTSLIEDAVGAAEWRYGGRWDLSDWLLLGSVAHVWVHQRL